MLPDRLISKGQKMLKNGEKCQDQKLKCDIFDDFQTMWHSGLSGGFSPKDLWKKPVADVLDFCLVRSKANEDVEKCFVTTC